MEVTLSASQTFSNKKKVWRKKAEERVGKGRGKGEGRRGGGDVVKGRNEGVIPWLYLT